MSPAFFPSLQRALDAAAIAGRLAGATCEALLTKTIPSSLVDDETVFDEGAAAKYPSDGLPGLPGLGIASRDGAYAFDEKVWSPVEPPLTQDELVAIRQLIEDRFGPPIPSTDGEARAASGLPVGECPAPSTVPGGGAGHLASAADQTPRDPHLIAADGPAGPELHAHNPAGRTELTATDLARAARAAREWAGGIECHNRELYRSLACRLGDAANALNASSK